MRSAALLFAVALLAACQKPETPEQASARMSAESDSAKTAIEAANGRYARYMNDHHADSVAMMFTEGGLMMGPSAPTVAGRDSIRAAMTRMPLPPGATLAFTAVDVAANGPIAIEHGSYTFSMPAMGRMPASTMTGKYLAHWHKMDGGWQIAAEVWNEDAPMPPMPAARK
jgi:uncharacterized protein (TIGR02246 family)